MVTGLTKIGILLVVLLIGVFITLKWMGRKASPETKGKSLTTRIFNLFHGKLERTVDEAEMGDPDTVYREAIEDIEHDIRELKGLLTTCNGEIFKKNEEISKMVKEKGVLERSLESAMKSDNDDLATEIILRTESIDSTIADLELQKAAFMTQKTQTSELYESRCTDLTTLKAERTIDSFIL